MEHFELEGSENYTDKEAEESSSQYGKATNAQGRGVHLNAFAPDVVGLLLKSYT